MSPPGGGKAWMPAAALASLLWASWAGADDDPGRARRDARGTILAGATWSLRLPSEEKVLYQGVANLDTAGVGGGPMLYTAPNLVAGLAEVITHGVIVGSLRSRQKSKLQKEADRVLLPYRSVLDGYSYKELEQRGLERLSSGAGKAIVRPASDAPDTDWTVESAPVFSMTQDQMAIVLENPVAMYAHGSPSKAAYQNVIKVVSRARDEPHLIGYWTANQGEQLKEESAILFARSLELALEESAGGPARESGPQKTFRYFEGGLEKMERAQLIIKQCGRLVIKTLRGWLMSIPARDEAGEPECPATRASQERRVSPR